MHVQLSAVQMCRKPLFMVLKVMLVHIILDINKWAEYVWSAQVWEW